MNEELNKIIEDLKNGLLKKADVEAMIKGFANAEDVAAVKQAAEDIGMKIKSLEEKLETKNAEPETLRSMLEKKQAEIVEATKGMGGRASLTLKTDVLLSSITTDKVGRVIPGFNTAAAPKMRVRDIFTTEMVGADSHGQIFYTDQTTNTNNAAAKAEGAKAPESAIAWTGRVAYLEEIKDSIPVSKKSLSHISQLEGTISDFVMKNLMTKENADLWSGNGTTPNLKGIYTYADTFNHAAYAGNKYADATLSDLIAVLNTEITAAYGGKYTTNFVVMNPKDVLRMKLAKDTNGNYVIPPFTTEAGMVVDGIRVIEDGVVTANTMVIGDFNQAKKYIGEYITLEWGYVGDQFTEGMITLYGHMDELLLVKTIDTKAFLKVTDITAAITAINSPS